MKIPNKIPIEFHMPKSKLSTSIGFGLNYVPSNWLYAKAWNAYLNGEVYSSQLNQTPKFPLFWNNPPNMINGNTRVGTTSTAVSALLNIVPLNNPKEFPTKLCITIIKQKIRKF